MIVYVLLGLAGLFINLHSDIAVPMNKPFAEFPVSKGDWNMISNFKMDEASLKVLKAADYIHRRYTDAGGNTVTLYMGYHSGGKGSGGIHSPKHCLPGSGWFEASEKKMKVDAGAGEINLVKAVYQKGDSKELFLYWYEVKGKSLSDEYSLKIAEIMGSVVHRRRDSAFIRVSVPFETDEEQAFAAGKKFIKDFYPLIRDFLPK